MDPENKKALDVLVQEGPIAASKYMMQTAGGDYGTMRMMYG